MIVRAAGQILYESFIHVRSINQLRAERKNAAHGGGRTGRLSLCDWYHVSGEFQSALMMDEENAARSAEVGGLRRVRRRRRRCEMWRSECEEKRSCGGDSECLKETQKVLRRLLEGSLGVRGRMHPHIPDMPVSL
ncbi:Hypothetical predicted protein [Xyrichtys novacula]|uniref:Uncharacterized protein n=1 Tax=Xyrichtys novacula TaxID=13765 RepID=A0AAV1F4K6_XYRNO|nr:Hypothetical predicted protein [Xyrichtys novacula]